MPYGPGILRLPSQAGLSASNGEPSMTPAKTMTLIILLAANHLLMAECQSWVEGNTNIKINRIDLDAQNVFNPAIKNEDSTFHQTANRLRTQTKDHVIRRELLFKVGDQLDLRVLAETARNLRSLPFIKDAMVYPTEQCDHGATIQVVTKDNWTLQPGISFGVSGGKSKHSFELQEKNLFGLGKSLEFKYKKGLVRKEKSIEYHDPNLWGSTRTLSLGYQNNSDGKQTHFNLQQPFNSLNTKFAWEADHLDWRLVNPIYDAGQVVDEIGQDLTKTTIQAGKLISSAEHTFHRLSVGLTSDKSTFFNSSAFPQTQLPGMRDFMYPWLSYELLTEDFITKTNFNSMGRTEDISLGHQLKFKLGQDINHSNTYFDLNYKKGYSLSPKNLVKFNAYAHGIHNTSGLLNTHFGIRAKWYHFQSSHKTFFVSTLLDMGNKLFADQPQYLGAETGLRGYPFRYLNGDHVWLTTAEQRFFYDWYPLHTFQFASALFIDAGSTWSNGQTKQIFTNLGVGIRLVPTRTSGGQVIHLDLAFPTTSRPDIDSVQLQIRAKKTF